MLLLPFPGGRGGGNGQKLYQGRFRLCIKKNSSWKGCLALEQAKGGDGMTMF